MLPILTWQTEGRHPTSNQPKPPTKVCRRVNKRYFVQMWKKYSPRLLSNHLFSCIKDPKHFMPPSPHTNKIKRTKENYQNQNKPLGLNVPGKKVFQERNLQSPTTGCLRESVCPFQSELFCLLAAQDVWATVQPCSMDWDLQRSLPLGLDSKQIQHGWQHLCSVVRNT